MPKTMEKNKTELSRKGVILLVWDLSPSTEADFWH